MISKIKNEIPEEYHFLLYNRLINTSQMEDKYRIESMQRQSFNRCEKCEYDLFKSDSYKPLSKGNMKFPIKGYVHYYHQHKLVLCDYCVDKLNGQPWR